MKYNTKYLTMDEKQALMDNFFATTSYDKTGDWKRMPETGEAQDENPEPTISIAPKLLKKLVKVNKPPKGRP